MNKRTAWFIDENEAQLLTYREALREILPESIRVEALFPHCSKDDFLALLDDPSTACIIIDQRLKNTGIANYTGIELARYLRGVNSKIPIYILTNYADVSSEFAGSEWSVEDIIDKASLNDEEHAFVLRSRIVRRIDVYEDVLKAREMRFNELLRKSLKDELDEDERKELTELQFERTSSTLATELAHLEELEETTRKYKEVLKQLRQEQEGGAVDGKT